MARVILYYAHPGQKFSQVNAEMYAVSGLVEGLTRVDLYAEYPRFEVNPDREQKRLLEHDIIVFQYPLFWYSTPSLIKEWQDIVLEHGFAYGTGGTRLEGKRLMLAVTAAGPQEAFSPQGYQHHHLRTFLRPLQQMASLCGMRFLPPYVLYGALREARAGHAGAHVQGYRRLLEGLRDGRLGEAEAEEYEVLTAGAPGEEV